MLILTYFIVLIATIIILLILLNFFQEYIILFLRVKEKNSYKETPKNFGLNCEDIWIITADGVKLHGWWILRSETAPILVYCHGNSKNIGKLLLNVVNMVNFFNYNLFVFDYRGYGLSCKNKIPTFSGLRLDINAVMDFVIKKRNEEINSKIILYGHSLGGAIVIDYVHRHPHVVDCLILENTFTSMRNVCGDVLPLLKWLVPFIIRDEWKSIELIKDVVEDTVFVYGKKDELIPYNHTLQLYNKMNLPRKILIEVDEGDHNNTFNTGAALISEKFHQFFER